MRHIVQHVTCHINEPLVLIIKSICTIQKSIHTQHAELVRGHAFLLIKQASLDVPIPFAGVPALIFRGHGCKMHWIDLRTMIVDFASALTYVCHILGVSCWQAVLRHASSCACIIAAPRYGRCMLAEANGKVWTMVLLCIACI